MRPVDLAALARQSAAEHQQSSGRHRIRVRTATEGFVGVWDAARLGRVLANLFANAIKYSPAGGEITVSLDREQVGGAAWAVLVVHDTGIGIPAADLPHIFEHFRRGRNVEGRISGTGIGLAGARQIVEQHGGSVAITSTEGAGTSVTVRLPLRPPQSDTAAAPA
jgi:signal transduction histidine kinase